MRVRVGDVIWACICSALFGAYLANPQPAADLQCISVSNERLEELPRPTLVDGPYEFEGSTGDYGL